MRGSVGKKRALLVSCSLLFCLLWLTPQPSPAGNNEPSTINFAEEANWPPFTPDHYGFAEEGLSLQLMQAIFSRLDIKVTIELFPQKRLLKVLQTGEKDGATVISKSISRMNYLDFTEAIFVKRGYVYYLASRPQPVAWHDFSDLRDLKIAITAGHNYGGKFLEAIEKYRLEIIMVNRDRQGFDMLLTGRVDVFLCIDLTANKFLSEDKYRARIAHAPKSYYNKDYHIAFSQRSETRKLIPKVNKVIRTMKKDGSLAKLLRPYLK